MSPYCPQCHKTPLEVGHNFYHQCDACRLLRFCSPVCVASHTRIHNPSYRSSIEQLGRLPGELMSLVFGHLDPVDLGNLRLVCRSLNEHGKAYKPDHLTVYIARRVEQKTTGVYYKNGKEICTKALIGNILHYARRPQEAKQIRSVTFSFSAAENGLNSKEEDASVFSVQDMCKVLRAGRRVIDMTRLHNPIRQGQIGHVHKTLREDAGLLIGVLWFLLAKVESVYIDWAGNMDYLEEIGRSMFLYTPKQLSVMMHDVRGYWSPPEIIIARRGLKTLVLGKYVGAVWLSTAYGLLNSILAKKTSGRDFRSLEFIKLEIELRDEETLYDEKLEEFKKKLADVGVMLGW